jgi:hypothetical protein
MEVSIEMESVYTLIKLQRLHHVNDMVDVSTSPSCCSSMKPFQLFNQPLSLQGARDKCILQFSYQKPLTNKHRR